MVNLDNFAGAPEDPRQKQLRWVIIKQKVPPLGEPYYNDLSYFYENDIVGVS